MIRKPLSLTVALLLALSASASAAGSLGTAQPSTLEVRDAPECGGKGSSKWPLTGAKGSFGCTHTAGDALVPLNPSTTRGFRPAVAKVPCYGDGTTGPRIQMIYGYYDGLPNRIAAVTKQFRTEMAPRMQAVINGQDHGFDLGLRFLWTKGCGGIDIKAIKFPRSVQYGHRDPGNPGAQLTAAADYLEKLGYDRDDRKYQILWDGWAVGACGVGFQISGGDASRPYSSYAEGRPTIGGRTSPNDVFDPLPELYDPFFGTTLYARPVSRVSMVFNATGAPLGPTCFDTVGISTVEVPIHELFHTLGAVQPDAPHFTPGGHCHDAPSVMCSGRSAGYGLGTNHKQCSKVLVQTLDCGEDDYWNPEPKQGSYLYDHLNIAKSQFFGAQLQDNLSFSPL